MTASVHADVSYSVSFNGAAGTTSNSQISGVTGGTAMLTYTNPNTAAITIATPTMGNDGFLRVTQNNSTTLPGATLAPTAANGFQALTTKNGAQANMNGGFDLFLRSSSNITGFGNGGAGDILRAFSLGPSGSGATRKFGINLSSGFGSAVYLQLRNGGTGADTFSDITYVSNTGVGSGSSVNQLNVGAGSGFKIAANTTYHIGATFSTSATDVITLRLFAVAGDGAIDTTSNTNRIGEVSFKVTDNAGIDPAAFVLGLNAFNTPNVPITQDFDRFSIYTGSTLTMFSAIPEPGSLGLLGFGVLALRRRRGR